jgi:LysM repeat protein/lysophospholipase L1-like esterase
MLPLSLLLAIMCLTSTACAQEPDSIRSPSYVKRMIRYNQMYPFIRYDINYLEWTNADAIEPFFIKLANADRKKVKVLHIGDSHVQADFFPGYIRENIQQVFGHGGRGFIFPYACANTHATYDYKTYDYGTWECAKNIQHNPMLELGVPGVTIRTTDSNAGFKFVFIRPNIIHKSFNEIKIYYRQVPETFNLKMKCAGSRDTVYIDCRKTNKAGYITVRVPEIGDTLQFWVDKKDTNQRFFELYGILVENSANSGILYNSVGINGAGYTSILKQSLFPFQVAELDPDLVIIDVGANDFYPRMIVEPEFQNNLAGVIEMVRKASPKACIIVSCSQDIYKRSKNIAACKRFSEIARTVAFQKGCVFYDYYNISGGQYSMMKWLKAGLAKKDKVHLTGDGYNVKGQLYLNAMLNSYLLFLKGELKDTFLVKNGVEAFELTPTPPDTARKNVTPPNNNGQQVQQGQQEKLVTHKIRSGETLGGIAAKYGVTVTQIKNWNNMTSNKLVAGKTLKIYVKGSGTGVNKPNNNKSDQENNTPSPAAKTYTVKTGDSLWSIAQKFSTTVENLKKLNGLKSNDLQPGMKLVISK